MRVVFFGKRAHGRSAAPGMIKNNSSGGRSLFKTFYGVAGRQADDNLASVRKVLIKNVNYIRIKCVILKIPIPHRRIEHDPFGWIRANAPAKFLPS